MSLDRDRDARSRSPPAPAPSRRPADASSTSRSASPTSTRRRTSARRPSGALDDGLHPLPAVPRPPGAARGDRRGRARRARASRSSPDHVFVTVGGKGVMLYAILALVDPGDEVIVPDPGYPIYESITRFVGGTPVPIPIRMEHDFRLDLDELASLVTPRTRLLVINSPANPTGGVLTRERHRADRRARAPPRPRRPRRRDLRPDPVRRREHVSIASLPGHGRADDRPRRLLARRTR